MFKYFCKRIALSIIVLLGVIVIAFMVTRVLPTDVAAKWAGPKATAEQIEAAREELGLDLPVYQQFFNYCGNLMRFDLGKSYVTHRPVTAEIMGGLMATVELVLLADLMGLLVGIFLGLYSARHKNKFIDYLCRFSSITFVSMPSFWLGLCLQLVFFGMLALLPLGGRLSTEMTVLYSMPHITGMLLTDTLLTGNLPMFWDALKHLILPVIVVSIYPTGLVLRQTRSALLEILNEDYMTAAKSYGLKPKVVYWGYALKNCIGPTITAITYAFAYTLTNTCLTETIFSWPGIGKYIANAVTNYDFPAIMGTTVFSAFVYVIFNLVADLIAASDPRVRK